MKTGTITHDILASDAYLIYRWGVTPEGEGMMIRRENDGWRCDDTGRLYPSVDAAKAAFAD